MKTKSIILLVFYILFTSNYLLSQRTFVASAINETFNLLHSTAVIEIEIGSCDNVDEYCHLDLIRIYDMSQHPDGYIYAIGSLIDLDVFDILQLRYIWKIDIENCEVIDSFRLNNYINLVEGIACDHLGNIYFTESTADGCRMMKLNPSSGEMEATDAVFQNMYLGGMFYSNGLIHGSFYDNENSTCGIIQFDINNFQGHNVLYARQNINYLNHTHAIGAYFGICVIPASVTCENTEFYNITRDTLVFINSDSQLSNICVNPRLAGARGPLRTDGFLGADPECDLLIDLDRDNSGGRFPYDFENSALRCSDTYVTTVADRDAFLLSSVYIDSLVFVLSDDLDGALEFLHANDLTTIHQWNTDGQKYTLTLEGEQPDSVWIEALRSVSYENSAVRPSPGQRIIEVRAYNSIKTATATSYIDVHPIPDSGIDTTLIICSAQIKENINHLIRSVDTGYWEPSFAGGGDSFDPLADIYDEYRYITQSEYCGSDTAVVQIHRVPERSLNIPGPFEICSGEEILIVIETEVGDSIEWADGTIGAERVIDDPDIYVLKLITQEGCQLVDSIVVLASGHLEEKMVVAEVCEGEWYEYNGNQYEAGSVIIDTLHSISGCDTLLRIQIETILLELVERDSFLCPGQTYLFEGNAYSAGDTVISYLPEPEGCDKELRLYLTAYEVSAPQLKVEHPILCSGEEWSSVSSDLPLMWSNGMVGDSAIFGIGEHSAVYISEDGCLIEQSFEIRAAESPEYSLVISEAECEYDVGSIRVEFESEMTVFLAFLDDSPLEAGTDIEVGIGDYVLSIKDAEAECRYDSLISITALYPGLNAAMTEEVHLNLAEEQRLELELISGVLTGMYFEPQEDIRLQDGYIWVTGVEDRAYEVYLIGEGDCVYQRELRVRVLYDDLGNIWPNAIHRHAQNPENSRFYLPLAGVIYDLEIYDRWGSRLYAGDKLRGGDFTLGWEADRSNIQPGVYVYVATIYTSDGESRYVGTVTVF
jgi:hypothetical protein